MKDNEFITSTDINEILSGRLWRITATNGARNFMYGTAHYSDPYVNTLSPEVRLAIGLSDEIMLETVSICNPAQVCVCAGFPLPLPPKILYNLALVRGVRPVA